MICAAQRFRLFIPDVAFSFLFLSIITMYSGKIHRHEYTPQTQSARLYSVVKQYINLYIKKGDIVFQQ